MLSWLRRRNVNASPADMGCTQSRPSVPLSKGPTTTSTFSVTADSSSTKPEVTRQLTVVEPPCVAAISTDEQQQPGVQAALAGTPPSEDACPSKPSTSGGPTEDGLAAPASALSFALKQQNQDDQQQGLKQAVPEAPAPSITWVSATKPQRYCNPDTSTPMSELIHSVASLSRAGREVSTRKTNQDHCFAFQEYLHSAQGLFAVLDGHGPCGHLVSTYLQQHMPTRLAEHFANCAPLPAEAASAEAEALQGRQQTCATSALLTTFLTSDAAMADSVDCKFSGSAVALTLLEGRRLTTAWVGDCRAVLAREDSIGLRAVPLTRDHKPTCPAEKRRILSAGGRVEQLKDNRGQPLGPPRVWLSDSWIPGLAMSRALGDTVAHTAGVSSEPELSMCEVTPKDRFLILATDGLWEFVDSQTAVELVASCSNAEQACRTLVNTAWSHWVREEEVVDDITAVVIKFQQG